MVLPTNYATMSVAQQTFVVSNLERVDRGLQPAAGTVAILNSDAQTGADNDADPTLGSWTIGSFNANRWGSIWAGDLNALAADYDWMYDDGWGPNGSFNLDCTSSTAAGCWGHRDNILSTYGGEELITGVAAAAQSQWTSIAQIFVAGTGAYPAFVTSWSSVSSHAEVVPPGTSTPPTGNQNPTRATIATTTTVIAGHSASVVGRVVDAMTGLPLATAGVLLCHRTALETIGACQSMLTDSTGTVRLTVRPTIRTAWWIAFTGSATNAAASSIANSLNVRSAVSARTSRVTGGWHVAGSFAPVRGQVVRFQVRAAVGWVTLSKVTLRTRSLAYTVRRSGRYRIYVGAVRGLLDNAVYFALR